MYILILYLPSARGLRHDNHLFTSTPLFFKLITALNLYDLLLLIHDIYSMLARFEYVISVILM
jgi:hypothetical protein